MINASQWVDILDLRYVMLIYLTLAKDIFMVFLKPYGHMH